MSPYDDDDDWVGTPPEGHYTRDRADPELWRRQRPVSIAAAVIVLLVLVLVVVVLVSFVTDRSERKLDRARDALERRCSSD